MKRSITCLALLAFCLLPVHAVSSQEASLETIMDGWANALGGEERLADAQIIHVEYKVTMFGLEGVIHEWSAADGRHHLDLDLAGMFRIVMVSDGKSGWMRDQNGKIAPLAGMDLKNEVTAAYVGSFSYLIKDRLPGTVKYMGTEDVTGYHIVRTEAEGGIEVTFYLDPETYLPIRTEQPSQERTLTAALKDWKEFDGLRYPMQMAQSTGDPQYDQSFELVNVEFNATPPAMVFQKPVDKAQDWAFTKGNSALGIPIELNFVHIFVQTRVNGSEPLWFILDTGASVTVLNTSTAQELGMDLEGKIEGRGAGEGSVEANLIPDVTFEMPGVTISDQTAVGIPFDNLEPLMGRRLDGVFGYDMISRFVVEIDYENEKLNLYGRGDYQYKGNGARVPMHIEGGSPYVTGTVTMIDGKQVEAEFLVDTGAAMALGFAKPFTEKHDLLESVPDKFLFAGGFGVGGESKSYIGRIKSLELGGLSFVNPVAGFSQDKKGAGADPNRAGLLGGEILKRCTVVFDYERGEMILEPNSNYEGRFNISMSGLAVQTGGRGDWQSFSIRKVLPDSPAAEAGFEVGDVIETIDGRPAAEYTIHTLDEYFKREGETVHIVISRDGKTLEKSIQLRKAI